MGNWRKYKISDICEGIYEGPHATPKESQTGGIYLGIPAISQDGHINFNYAKRIAEEDLPQWTKRVTPQKDDIVFTNEATLNLYALIPEGFHGCLGRRLGLVRPNKKHVNAKYLFYYFFSPEWRNTISQNKVYGATVERILMKKFPSFPVTLPPLEIQNKIVNILSSLDEKLEYNRRINENLEQQAQALFKSWFVDFEPFKDQPFVESEIGMIPQGWKVVSIGELPIIVTDYVANGSFASLKENVKLYQEEEYAYFIRNTDLKSGDFGVFVDKHSYDFLSKSRLFGGEIIISNVGDVGSVFLCPRLNKPMTLGNNIIMIKAEEDLVNTYLYILFRWSYGQGLIKSITGGSAQPKFNKTDFKSLKLIMPSESIVSNYVSKLRSMIDVVESNKKEIKCLAELRDTLLPKLMSGELNVENVNI